MSTLYSSLKLISPRQGVAREEVQKLFRTLALMDFFAVISAYFNVFKLPLYTADYVLYIFLLSLVF